jgi:hypothetical protein
MQLWCAANPTLSSTLQSIEREVSAIAEMLHTGSDRSNPNSL